MEQNMACDINELLVNACVIDWTDFRGKLPIIKEDSFVITFDNGIERTCKNWADVWRTLLELFGEYPEIKKEFLKLRESELEKNKYGLKTFFGGQKSLKKKADFTRAYRIESLGVEVENYWNKENMCKEIKKLCRGLSIDFERIVIKGILEN